MMMLVHLRVLPAQHVDLRCGNALRFQLLFKDLQVVEAVAYKIMP
jgi:NifU-like protein involved in Fe-S cluster formation